MLDKKCKKCEDSAARANFKKHLYQLMEVELHCLERECKRNSAKVSTNVVKANATKTMKVLQKGSRINLKLARDSPKNLQSARVWNVVRKIERSMVEKKK